MRTEPTLILSAVAAIIGLLIAFGAPITEDQRQAVLVCVGALIPLAIAIRQSVFAPATVETIATEAAITRQVPADLKPPSGK